jgi:hypothetical protein
MKSQENRSDRTVRARSVVADVSEAAGEQVGAVVVELVVAAGGARVGVAGEVLGAAQVADVGTATT